MTKNIDISHKLKREIIELFKKNERLSLGELVSKIRAPYNDILNHLIDLKTQGIILKIPDDLGYFRLNEKYKNI